jgi:hypothetical protein
MGPEGIVLPTPALDDDLGFPERVEDLAVQQLVPKLSVEGFHVSVLPGAARLDEERLYTYSLELLSYRSSGEFAAVVAAQIGRNSSLHKELCQTIQHVLRAILPGQCPVLSAVLEATDTVVISKPGLRAWVERQQERAERGVPIWD